MFAASVLTTAVSGISHILAKKKTAASFFQGAAGASAILTSNMLAIMVMQPNANYAIPKYAVEARAEMPSRSPQSSPQAIMMRKLNNG